MSTAIKRRRGTAAEHSTFAGLEGELTVNTTNDSVHVHDGTTAGGFELARADGSNVSEFKFGDNDKAVFGAGSDLEIFHDGNNSYIKESGTGSLLVRGVNLSLQDSSNGENYLVCQSNNEVSMYFDGAKKLATTSTGVDVTGTVTADGLTVDGSVGIGGSVSSSLSGWKFLETNNTTLMSSDTGDSFYLSGNAYYSGGWKYAATDYSEQLYFNNGGMKFANAPSGTAGTAITYANRFNIDSNGDISFYEDTGTTAKFFWDASAERLGIGTSSPNDTLDVNGGAIVNPNSTGSEITSATIGLGSNIHFQEKQPAGAYSDRTDLAIVTNTGYGQGESEKMRIDSSGNLLVGTTSTTTAQGAAKFAVNPDNNDAYFAVDQYSTALLSKATTASQHQLLFANPNGVVGKVVTNGNYTSFGNPTYGGIKVGNGYAIQPSTGTGNDWDGTLSLGTSTNKFQDLYLSGGVYLGGIGAANLLDDYETGTWTPTSTSGSFTTASGTYTKVGRQVSITFSVTGVPNSGNFFQLNGLPFTITTNGFNQGSISKTSGGANDFTVFCTGSAILLRNLLDTDYKRYNAYTGDSFSGGVTYETAE